MLFYIQKSNNYNDPNKWTLTKNKKPIILKNKTKIITYNNVNTKFQYEIKAAAKNWNQLHLVTFKYTNKNTAAIKLSSNYVINKQQYATTTNQYSNCPSNKPTTQAKNTQIHISPLFDKLSTKEKILVLTHEFGHTLGLNDDTTLKNGVSYIMNPQLQSKYHKIGNYEKTILKKYY